MLTKKKLLNNENALKYHIALPGNVQLVQRRSDGLGSQWHGPRDVQQRVAHNHVPGGNVRGAGPLGHAFPPDQAAPVPAVPAPQHRHRVQPVLLTVAAATAATAAAATAAATAAAAAATRHDGTRSSTRERLGSVKALRVHPVTTPVINSGPVPGIDSGANSMIIFRFWTQWWMYNWF